jgi:hypothetical protein
LAASQRHLQHCIVERDPFHSRFRQLARDGGAADWNQVLAWGAY